MGLTAFHVLAALFFSSCSFSACGAADQSGYYCEDIKKPFFARSASGGEFTAQRPMAQPEKFSMPKPAGVKRVFVVGESVAAILGSGREVTRTGTARGTLGSWLSEEMSKTGLLKGAASPFEIINCGMGGYESYRIYGVLKEILNYSPDLVVVLSGNHEGSVEQPCPGLDFEFRRREFNLLEHYYSIKDDPLLAQKKASLKMHGEMLAKMARAAKKAGVPIIFCTLPVNVKDMPSRRAVSLDNLQFASGYRLFYEKKYPQALKEFKLALAADPREHFSNFYLAKTLEKLGRTDEAKSYFLSALEFDYEYTRAEKDRNALIKQVAAAEGACVADLEKVFAGISPSGLPGFREFTDGMHWRPSYNKLVWDNFFRSAGACGIKGFEDLKPGDPSSWAESRREDMVKRLNYAFSWVNNQGLNEGSLAELAYIKEVYPALLKEASVSPEKLQKILIRNFWTIGKDIELESLFPFLLAHLAETERRAGNYKEALSLCEKAAELKPKNKTLLLERAQILYALGRKKEAEEAFLSAGNTSGSEKTGALALAYGFTEKRGNAGIAVKTETRIPASAEKSQPKYLLDSCMSLSGQNKKEEALQACQSAVYAATSGVEKDSPGMKQLTSNASYESYKLLAALGRGEEAKETLLWTVENAPASWTKIFEAKKLLENYDRK